MIVGGLLLAGGVCLLLLLTFGRAALETEPGGVGAFKN